MDFKSEEITWNTTEWLSEFNVYTDHVTERRVSFNSILTLNLELCKFEVPYSFF